MATARKGYTPVDRRELGRELAELGCVRELGACRWLVLSPGSGNAYEVERAPYWQCPCPDHRYRGADCKHIQAVLAYLGEDPWAEFEREEGGESDCPGLRY